MKYQNMFFSLSLAAVLGACSSAPPPEDHFYRLAEVAAPHPLDKPLFSGVLEVKRPLAEGVTGSQSILYLQPSPAPEIAEYHYHFWASPPAQMLQEMLIQTLRQARVADQIVSPEHRAQADHEVMGRLIRFERITSAPSRVAVTLELAVRQRKGRDLLLVKQYAMEIPEHADGIPGAVEAFGEGVAKIYAQFIEDLKEALPTKGKGR